MKKKLLTAILFIPYLLPAQVKEVSRFQNDHARQAVVVDEAFIYVIDNAAIAKLRKQNFEPVASWQDTTGTIPHLNNRWSGLMTNGGRRPRGPSRKKYWIS